MGDYTTVAIGQNQSQKLDEIATREAATKRDIVDALVDEYYREFYARPKHQKEHQTNLKGIQKQPDYQPAGGQTHSAPSDSTVPNDPEKEPNRNVVFEL